MGANVSGSFHWNELRVRDVEKTKQFYADVIGWTYEEMPMEQGGTYCICKSGDQMVAGLFEMNQESGFPDDVPPHWLGYIQVDDVDHCLDVAKGNGSEVFFGPMDVPEVGRFAVLSDAEGAAIGLITPPAHEA